MVTKMKITLVLILASSILANCQKANDLLPIKITDFTYKGKLIYNNQFKINGYYYCQEKGYYCFYYFYNDGTIGMFASEDSSKYVGNQNNSCIPITDWMRNNEYLWGYYVIEGDIIKVQQVHPRPMSGKSKLDEYRAKIVNDTTIQFYKRIFPDGVPGDKEVAFDQLLKFQSCIDKPDSTNVLMKY